MNKSDIVKRLKDLQGSKSIRSLAKDLGVSAPYLQEVFNGTRNAGPKILTKLGLVKVTDYQEVKQ